MDVDCLGRHAVLRRQFGKGGVALGENPAHRIVLAHHRRPHVGADGVVRAQGVVVALFGHHLALEVKAHPVGGKAARGGAHQSAHRALNDGVPLGILLCKAAQDKDRVVARIEGHEVLLLKALVAR